MAETMFTGRPNGGTWTLMPCPGSGSFAGFASGILLINNILSPPDISWTVRNDNKVYQNYNMGSWSPVYTAPAGVYMHIGATLNSTLYTWAIRSNGGITRITTAYGGVRKISSAVPGEYSLSQNYPNPFNPVTQIKFKISKLGLAKVVVFNILGCEITELANGQMAPGTYELSWDGSDYPSGVYYCKFLINDYIDTKKMVLLK